MSNVPEIEFTPEGLVLPEASAVLAGVQQDFNEAFGGNLNPALETPQGQLATSLTAVIVDKNAELARVVNQINPDTADGFFQDAIARIYFLNRSPGAPTVVQCELVGAQGATIPVGAQAQDTSGNRYVCLQSATFGPSGTLSLQFANVENGPVPCPPNTLTAIYQAIPGWDTINNQSAGTLGRDIETQQEFAYRRQESVAINARGSLTSIYAAVFDVPGVLDVFAYENVTSFNLNVGSTAYTLVPHSLYIAAVGGTDEDIAQAIWRKKDVGCDYNGNTSVVVTDSSGYLNPQPTYTVKFQRPAALPVKVEVQIQDDPDLPADIVALVKAAVIATFNGTDGSQRVRIGSMLLASKFYPGVIRISAEVSVLSILIGSVTPTLVRQQIGIDQAPTITAADISVVLVP